MVALQDSVHLQNKQFKVVWRQKIREEEWTGGWGDEREKEREREREREREGGGG